MYTRTTLAASVLLCAPLLGTACTARRFDVPYREVVDEVHDLYPIYIVATYDPETKLSTGIQEAKDRALRHPAYRDAEPCWDVDVTYTDVTPDSEHTVKIVNWSKLWSRRTVIRIRALGSARTEVSIDSREKTYFEWFDRRNFGYQSDRMTEITNRLRTK